MREASIPAITGTARPFLTRRTKIRPPSIAPLVKPLSSKANSRIDCTFREAYATATSISAQKSVEYRLNRRLNSSLRWVRAAALKKSIVETEASAESAELTEDI